MPLFVIILKEKCYLGKFVVPGHIMIWISLTILCEQPNALLQQFGNQREIFDNTRLCLSVVTLFMDMLTVD